MEIVQVKHYAVADLMARLRRVPLQEQPDVKIYENALISLENIHTKNLHPPQNYVWLAELRKVQELRWSLQEHGLNMFNLNGFVSYTVREADGELVSYDLYPPIIEESFEADGTVALLINDGMHRVFLARSEWIVPQVIYVRGIPKEYPYYAYPRPQGWEGIDLLADNPDKNRYLKKCHRIRHNKALYRNFQAVFKNVGGSRSSIGK
jgi:hypothetical protein